MQSGRRFVTSAADRAYEALLERILSGEFPPGVRLVEEQLARDLQTSRTPVREALRRLGATAALVPDEAVAAGPFDVALELVGAPSLPDVLANLRTGGRVAVIGVGGGARMELDLLTVMSRRVRIGGSTLRARPLVDKALVAQAVAAHVVPLVASVMNVLSIGAAVGAITAAFQYGWLKPVLGFAKPGPIEVYLPVMMFAVLFGLTVNESLAAGVPVRVNCCPLKLIGVPLVYAPVATVAPVPSVTV